MLTESEEHLEARPAQNAPIADWKRWLQTLKNDKLRIDTTLERLDGYINQWTDIIMRTPAAEKANKNAEYSNVANGEEGLVAKMEEGYETVANLKSNIEVAEEAIRIQTRANALPQNNAQRGGRQNGHQQSLVRLHKTELPEFRAKLLSGRIFGIIFDRQFIRTRNLRTLIGLIT